MSSHSANQFSKYTTNTAVLEFLNKLRLNKPGAGSHIHAKGGGGNHASKIGIGLTNYGKGKPSVYVSCNIDIPQLFELYEEAKMKRSVFSLTGTPSHQLQEETKIFGEPDKDGLCQVTKLLITRQAKGKNNEVKNLPWYVKIVNGRGKKIKNPNGSAYMDGQSFVKDKEASVNVSDSDFFALLHDAVTYVRAWEATYSSDFVRGNEAVIVNDKKAYKEKKDNYSPAPSDGREKGKANSSKGESRTETISKSTKPVTKKAEVASKGDVTVLSGRYPADCKTINVQFRVVRPYDDDYIIYYADIYNGDGTVFTKNKEIYAPIDGHEKHSAEIQKFIGAKKIVKIPIDFEEGAIYFRAMG